MLDSLASAKVKQLANDIASREEVQLYDLELITVGGRKVLRVFISKKNASVSVDDCYRVSQALSLQLDVEDPIPFTYDLEVSSPGLERHLKEKWHFEEAIGENLKLTLDQARNFEGQERKFRNFEAKLVAIDDEKLILDYEGSLLPVPLVYIEKARIIFTFGRDKEKVSKLKKKGR